MAEQQTQVLGIVGVSNKGEYNSETNYEKLNVVTYNGSSYCATQNSKGKLPTNPDYWQLYAEKGDKGDIGPQGPKPIKGVDYYTNDDIEEIKEDLSSVIHDEISEQVGDLVSATPLAVSSVSQMADTSRIYVNTTDGKWYYYDGSAWVIGGTYQSSVLGENEVYYNSLDNLLKDTNYRTIHAEDLVWMKSFTINNGNLVYGADTITSSAFYLPKGSIVTIDSSLTGKITYYTIDKLYNTDTGSFANLNNYIVPYDGYAKISVKKSGIDYDSITNTNISFNGIIKKEINDSIRNNLVFSNLNETKVFSNKIYIGKGTKIYQNDSLIKNSSSADSDSITYMGVKVYENDKMIGDNQNMYTNSSYTNNVFTATKDCYVEIYMAKKYWGAFRESEIPILKNIISIEYCFPNSNPSIDYSAYVCYINNNGDVDIVERPHLSGAILFKISTGLSLYKNKQLVFSYTWEELKTMFSDNVVTYDDNQYIKVANNSEIVIDLNDLTLKKYNYTSGSGKLTGYVIPLLVNGYENAIDGLLLNQYIKKKATTGVTTDLSSIFNSGYYLTNTNFESPIKKFTDLFDSGGTNIETFFFYTDQHLLGTGNSITTFKPKLKQWLSTILKAYNESPANFIVSGGDWLNWSDDSDVAQYKMGYIDGVVNKLFKNHYMVLGNHDTNYQGTTRFDNSTITNLWFREYGRNYYKFNGYNSKNYVLDTGDGNYMNAYEWNQLDWLANELSSDDPSHATIFMHIVWNEGNVKPMADNITKLVKAYNDHTTITLNSITYNFTNKTGHVDYILSGHEHADLNDNVNGVLCIATTTFAYYTQQPNFDMVFNDYDNHKAHFIRFGSGEDREFDI